MKCQVFNIIIVSFRNENDFLHGLKWSTTVFALVTSVKSQACSCLKWIKNIVKIRLSNCQIKCLLSSPLKLHLNFTNDFCLKTLKEQSKLYFDSDKKLSFSSKLGIYIIFLASKIKFKFESYEFFKKLFLAAIGISISRNLLCFWQCCSLSDSSQLKYCQSAQ